MGRKQNPPKCRWHCGRETKNISRICDFCWANREAIYQARKAREAQVEPKPRTASQQAHIEKLNAPRVAKLAKDLLPIERLDTKTWVTSHYH
jgi:hypothetical protein